MWQRRYDVDATTDAAAAINQLQRAIAALRKVTEILKVACVISRRSSTKRHPIRSL